MSCCPPESLGQLGEEGYKPRGTITNRGDLPIYVVGSGSKAIIWNYDIFGFDSGRTKQLCDIVADAGYLVLLPDWFRGTWQDPFEPAGIPEFLNRTTQWDKILSDFHALVEPLATERGATTFGSVGTCWGSYPVVRFSALPNFNAGVSAHPSHSRLCQAMGVDEKSILEKVGCPQLFMPAGNDGDEVKAGGLGEQVLGSKLEIVEFPEMSHGWLPRGDMSKPEVARDVKKTMENLLAFFAKNL